MTEGEEVLPHLENVLREPTMAIKHGVTTGYFGHSVREELFQMKFIAQN